MKVGKLSSEMLQELVLNQVGFRRDDVLVHAGIGEDCAVVDFGPEVCVLSTDPITGAFQGAGRLAVHVACNDIAAAGARPVGVQVLLLVPSTLGKEDVVSIMEEISCEAARLGIEVLGGHTEITSRVLDPVISLTALGRAAKDCYVTSGGAKAGDGLVLTKAAGIEGSLVLAQDHREYLEFVTDQDLCRLETMLSVIPEGLAAAEFGVHAMHDVTEAGLIGACFEIGQASHVECCIEAANVPILPITEQICQRLGLDPLKLLSSGAMLISCPHPESLVSHMEQLGIPAAVVGTVRQGSGVVVEEKNGRSSRYDTSVEDELWRFLSSREA